MIIIKFINLIGILLICIYLGNYKAKSYEIRTAELNKFQNALIMFKSKIEFTYEPIKNIFEDISKIIYEKEENIFLNSIRNEKEISSSWVNSTYSIFTSKYWPAENEKFFSFI